MPVRQTHPVTQYVGAVRESFAAKDHKPDPSNERVHLTLRIHTVDALRVRRALHDTLGERIGIYVMTVDHHHQRTTLQLQTTRGDVDAIMHAIMGGLLQAEFGPIHKYSEMH